ncbi:hypothetical protein [Mycolicibacterium phocaicum]|nr:hypothetical protein [Mycolicibacterium phocaicum]BBZ55024.1 hypothetical protein MPHO_20160 [Mycolicibacterium phocaicum]
MAGIDEETLIAAVADWQLNEVRILEPGATTRQLIPEAWWPVAESTDPDERKHAALDLWNEDFLALIPHYAHALQTALVDVRVAKHKYYSAPSLDYVLRTDEGELRVWAGDDPRTFGDIDPPLFDAVPAPVQTFLRQVHAGYATSDGETHGLVAPSGMVTLAARWFQASDTNEIIEWFEDVPFPGTQRLLFLTGNGDDIALYVSPDLPPGQAITYYEPDFEIAPFGEALDDFITRPLDN